MRMLLTAILSLGLTPSVVAAADLSPEQALIVACYQLDPNQVTELLRAGANVNGRFGMRAFEAAEFMDRWTGGDVLWGADAWTPLLALASAPRLPAPPAELGDVWKNPELVARLRARISDRDLAERSARARCILLILLSHDCKIDVHDGYGATALYMAADRTKTSIARILLKFGANPNSRTKVYIDGPGKTTPLHVASNSAEMMQVLLDHGADPTARDSEGRTPADWVALHSKRTFDLVRTEEGWRIVRREK
ncbi:MAG: ankyrin repeat domain-containing protein [Pirellulaceae bacterium]